MPRQDKIGKSVITDSLMSDDIVGIRNCVKTINVAIEYNELLHECRLYSTYHPGESIKTHDFLYSMFETESVS